MVAVTSPPRLRVYGVLALAIAAVSMAAIFVRLAAAPGVIVAAYRMIAASLLLLPVSVRALRATPPSRESFGLAALAGLLLGAHFATWITSLSYTSVAASVTLVSTIPLWVALLSWGFLGRRPRLAVLGGALLAVAGSVVIGLGGAAGGTGERPLLGDALALAGAVFAAAYFLLGRAAQRRGLSLNAYVALAYGAAAVTLLPLPGLLGIPYLPYGAATLGWILVLALVPQMIGHTGLNYAVKHLDPTLVSTLVLLEPLGAGLLAFWLFGEAPTAATAVGAALLLAGVGVAVWAERPRSVSPSRSVVASATVTEESSEPVQE